MTPRERALTRIRWASSFGSGVGRGPLERSLTRRLHTRLEAHTRPERTPLGAQIRAADLASRRARVVEAGPNAPLLMRIVRDPFPMRPGSSIRTKRPLADRARDRLDPAARSGRLCLAEVAEELHEALRHVAPMRQPGRRLVQRPRPFARIREQSP